MKTTCRKSWAGNLFQLLNLTFDPCFNVMWGYPTTKAFHLLYFSIITDSKAGDNRCGSGLVYYKTSDIRGTMKAFGHIFHENISLHFCLCLYFSVSMTPDLQQSAIRCLHSGNTD